MGDAGTVAARSPPARWVAEDESDCTALGDAWPEGAQGGAQFVTKDRLCSQLPVTVVGMFLWLCRVPQAGTVPGGIHLCCCHCQTPSGPVKSQIPEKNLSGKEW